MRNGIIAVQEIESGLPDKVRGHLLVEAATLFEGARPVIQSFWMAVGAILPSVRLTTPVHVLFSTNPFDVNLGNSRFTFTCNGAAVNMHMENFIFIDTVKTAAYPRNLQVAAILEELVHAMMNISDEVLVKHVVAHLFPGVRLIIRPGDEPIYIDAEAVATPN
jgi:hypothetical protein